MGHAVPPLHARVILDHSTNVSGIAPQIVELLTDRLRFTSAYVLIASHRSDWLYATCSGDSRPFDQRAQSGIAQIVDADRSFTVHKRVHRHRIVATGFMPGTTAHADAIAGSTRSPRSGWGQAVPRFYFTCSGDSRRFEQCGWDCAAESRAADRWFTVHKRVHLHRIVATGFMPGTTRTDADAIAGSTRSPRSGLSHALPPLYARVILDHLTNVSGIAPQIVELLTDRLRFTSAYIVIAS